MFPSTAVSASEVRPSTRSLVSLRRELLRVVLFAALPILVLTAGLILHLLLVQRAATTDAMAQTARVVALAVDEEASTWRAIAQTLASSPLLERDDLQGFRAFAMRVAANHAGLSIKLVRADGSQVFDTSELHAAPSHNLLVPVPGAAPGRGDIEQWRSLLVGGEPHYSNLLLISNADKPRLAYRWPVLRSADVRYGLELALPIDDLNRLLRRYEPASNWVLAVIDHQGTIVARNAQAERFVGMRATDSVQQARIRPGVAVTSGTAADGRSVLQATAGSAQTGWTVAIGAPAPVADGPVLRSLGLWSIGVLLSLALAVAVARRTWREVGRPLQVLAGHAGSLQRGEPIAEPESRVREVVECGRAWSLAVQAEGGRRDAERLRIVAEAQREQLESAARDKDRVLAALGHELRNPLGAISNGVQVMDELAPAEGRLRAMLDIVKRQTAHLSRLVDDMLDLTRATLGRMPMQRVPIALDRLARETAGGYAGNDPADAFGSPRVIVDAQPAWVQGDRTRLDQVIRNLLDNALKFSEANVVVYVRVVPMDGQVVLCVDDQGRGIPADQRERMFEAFQQGDAHGPQSGLGLGLSIVREIVRAHGGEVWIENAPNGTGTRVGVRLPACPPDVLAQDAPASASVEVSPPASLRHGDSRTLLLVEDQPDVRESLGELLHQMGWTITVAADGAAALAQAGHADFAVALIDLGLPDMRGTELAVRLRERASTTRLVAMTGFSEAHDREAALRAGFDAVLLKPLGRHSLAAALEPGTKETPP